MNRIGVIGGSGIYQIEGLEDIKEISLDTPFGKPSDSYITGNLNGIPVAFLSRHGRDHRISPSELNNRANIWGFKKLGISTLIGISAVGSLQEEIKPSHLVFPTQIIDRTKGRESSFFGNGIVAHIPFADPFCLCINQELQESAGQLGITAHSDKTYLCMEGPAFSTRAESNFHRMIGADIIGMTAIPESKLAKEAEICYGLIALSTDYDCWKVHEEAVTVDMVVATLHKNSETAKKLLAHLIPRIGKKDCGCGTVLDTSIITAREHWPQNTILNLEPILKRIMER